MSSAMLSSGRCLQAFLESSTRLLEMSNKRLIDTHQLTMFDFLVSDLFAKSNGGSARIGDLAREHAVGPSRVTQQIRPPLPAPTAATVVTAVAPAPRAWSAVTAAPVSKAPPSLGPRRLNRQWTQKPLRAWRAWALTLACASDI